MLSSLRRCEAADCQTKHLLLVLLFSVYVSLSKNSFLCACRCISEKRVQRYGLFQYPPNISAEKFKNCLIIDLNQAERLFLPNSDAFSAPTKKDTAARPQKGYKQYQPTA